FWGGSLAAQITQMQPALPYGTSSLNQSTLGQNTLGQTGLTQGGFGQTSTDLTGGTLGPSSLSSLTLGMPALGTPGAATGSPFIGQLGTGLGSTLGSNPALNQAGLGSVSDIARLGAGTGNLFYQYYGNPLYQGWPGNFPKTPGGWAVPLYQASTFGTLGTTGSAFGALSGLGSSGIANLSNSFGSTPSSVGSTRRPAYVTVVAFPVRPTPSGQVQTALRDIIARSSGLSQRDDIKVNMDGQAVVLRGEVADERERRLAESILRLTPGVHEVRNELKVKAP